MQPVSKIHAEIEETVPTLVFEEAFHDTKS
jgi:hypothetical protein